MPSAACGAAARGSATQAMEMAPKVPIRDLGTLREQYPGRDTEQLADSLIVGAASAAAGVGAAVGAAAAVPSSRPLPLELGVETLAWSRSSSS